MSTTKFVLLKRRSDLSSDQYRKHWHEVHGEVLLEAGHRDYNTYYVQNYFVPAPGLPFDGASQMELKTDFWSNLHEDPRYLRIVRPDEEKFLDVPASMVLFAEPRAFMPKVHTGLKVLVFARANQGVNREQLHNSAAEWQSSQSRDEEFSSLARSCTHHYCHAGGARGLTSHEFSDANIPSHQFDAIFEYEVESESSATAFKDLIAARWPNVLEARKSFVATSISKVIY